MTQQVYHIPALLQPVTQALDIKPGGCYVDVTFGGGGHSRAIMEQLGPKGRLIGFDQDIDARANAIDDPRFTFVHSNFRYLRNFLRYHNVGQVDGILADLGVSFHHFDDPERGFSFRWSSPLDMRMNRSASRDAAWLVANSGKEELTSIFKLYGELRQASRIADAIVKRRSASPITTTDELLETVSPFIDPRKEKKELAQVFQALRIVANDEMAALSQLLRQSLACLKPDGRLAVITYHSLEDRLVKNFMRTGNLEGDLQQDFYGRNLSPLRLLTTKPITASDKEVEANPRSRSAKLRVAQKLPDTTRQ